ncbi:MAG: hypothetical protein AB1384_04680 [Actinomycetota bacterium]
MLFIALIIGHCCGSIAESWGKDRKAWFRRGAIISFLIIWGWHQKHEYRKFKEMGIPLKDLVRERMAEREKGGAPA